MDEDIIKKLRREGQLTPMPDGHEGVPITLHFKGKLPALQRPERKQWLQHFFSEWHATQPHLPLQLDTRSVSLSGQTVIAVGSAEQLDDIRKAAESSDLHVEIVRSMLVGGDVIVVIIERRRPSHHGVGWRKLNPRLPEWWR
jgi:hypothetical protein